MNSKQRRKREREKLRYVFDFIEILEDLASDIESGRYTKEEFVTEIRKIKEGILKTKRKEGLC